jgi:DNA polymerase III subunit epsilon
MKLTKPIVFFDIETTGLSLSEDRIIEISMVKLTPENMDGVFYYKKINPEGRPIHPDAFGKHGIKLEDLAICPTFIEVAQEIYDFINGCDLGGYNCKRFDIPILIEEFFRAKIFINIKDFKIVDVYKILMKAEPRTLEATYKRFFGEEFQGAHSAESDILATIKILDKMEEFFKLPISADELHKYAFAEDGSVDLEGKLKRNKNDEIVFTFGKYKDKTVQYVYNTDSGYFDWIINSSDMTQYTKSIFRNVVKWIQNGNK